MKKTIVCPSCKEELEMPIKKCSTCGFIFDFQELKPVVPIEKVQPIEAVVPLDYEPEEDEAPSIEIYKTQILKKEDLEEPSIEIYKTQILKKEDLEAPTVEIFPENNVPKEKPKKERKRITKPQNIEEINQEKRMTFALILCLTISVLYLMEPILPLFSIIYESINKTELYGIYELFEICTVLLAPLIIAYFVLVATLSASKKKSKRKFAIFMTILSTIIQIGFMIGLQFVTLSAGIYEYIILLVLIIWSAVQISLLNIKREG